MGASIFIFITSFYLIQAVFNQRIQLFQHNKTSKCNIDVVKELDKIIMYGEVNHEIDNLSQSIVHIEIKSKYEKTFSSFCVLLIPGECDIRNYHYCSCYTTDKTDIYRILIYIRAENVTSDSQIVATLNFKESFMHSEVIKLPIVYGSPTDAITVYVNGHDVLKTNNVTLNDTNVIIYSICHEKFATNCHLQLTSLETQTILKSETQKLAYHDSIKERRRFSLELKICNIHEEIRFSVSTDNMEKNDDLNFPQSVSVLLNCVQSVVIIALFIVCIKFCIRKGVRWDYIKVGIWIRNRFSSHYSPVQAEQKDIESSANCNPNMPGQEVSGHCEVEYDKSTYRSESIPIQVKTHVDKNGGSSKKMPCTLDEHRQRKNNLPGDKQSSENLMNLLPNFKCKIFIKNILIDYGMVSKVLKYGGTDISPQEKSNLQCPCTKCSESQSPSKTWGEIFISTSKNIMKSREKEKCITFVFPTEEKVTTALRDLRIKKSKNTSCYVMKWVTCDQNLINRQEKLLEKKVLEFIKTIQTLLILYKENGTNCTSKEN